MQFSIIHRVGFSETDMAGVVHFSCFFKWMEEVEHAYFRSLGLSVAMMHEGRHIGWPRVTAKCDYTAPVRFEDEIECRLHVTRVGEKSFSYEVTFLKDRQPVASGSVTSVCCVMETKDGAGSLQAIAIPADIRHRLGSDTPR